MRTTLTLDDGVAAVHERLRKSRDASLKDLVNEVLRRGLKDMTSRTIATFERALVASYLFILRGRFRSHAISQLPWRRRSVHRRALRRSYQLDLELKCPVPAQPATA